MLTKSSRAVDAEGPRTFHERPFVLRDVLRSVVSNLEISGGERINASVTPQRTQDTDQGREGIFGSEAIEENAVEMKPASVIESIAELGD